MFFFLFNLVVQMLPKKVDTLTEAMDGIKEKIFASGPMEESETNVNAEEDRGIQVNINQLKSKFGFCVFCLGIYMTISVRLCGLYSD